LHESHQNPRILINLNEVRQVQWLGEFSKVTFANDDAVAVDERPGGVINEITGTAGEL